ncbi:MAG: PPC domain-containing protein [Planctomycetes bacterium]|nr:PPC domain-containing protein [Planctomycetota bacterium]
MKLSSPRRFLSPCPGLIVALAAILVSSQQAAAQQVAQIANVVPPGASRGAELTVKIAGRGLSKVEGLIVYEPGITVKGVKQLDERTAELTLAISSDCRLGQHSIRVVTAYGISELGVFSIGALAEVTEKEPNNEPAKAQQIELDTTVNGTANGDDLDYYVVQAKKGERLTAEIEGIRLGRGLFDPFVSISDANLNELANSDDDVLINCDAIASCVAPEEGKYFILVRDMALLGNGAYRVHIGRYPQPRAAYPPGGPLGQTVSVKLIGDVAGDTTLALATPKKASYRYEIQAHDDRGAAPSGIPFRLSTLANALEAEPNDTSDKATPVTAPVALNGILQAEGDIDRFKFTAKKGESYDVRLFGRSLRSPIDSVLTIERAAGGAVASNDDVGNDPDSALKFNVPADGEYVVVVKDMLNRGGPRFVYRVEITQAQPALSLSLPELRRYEDIVLPVPQGNRMALMMSAQRRDCSGDVAVTLKDLPPGFKAEVVPMPSNQSQTLFLVSAADDAAIGGGLVDLTGQLKTKQGDKDVTIDGHLEQLSMMVRVNNNRVLFGRTETRMATAVIRPVPFHLEIVEPKVPLVRNGSMELKVRCVRDKDYKAPVTMRMVYNPPGVSSSGSAMINEGQTEGIMPLTASKDAQTGDWRIVVVGSAEVGGQRVEVATQMVVLKVEESFFTFAFKPMAVDQGKSTDFTIDVDVAREFAGKAKLELLGLPAEAKAEPIEFDAQAEKVTLKVDTTAKTPGGRHKSLMCRATVMQDGEPIIHMLGPAELRVDVPLVKKETEKKPAPAPAQKSK